MLLGRIGIELKGMLFYVDKTVGIYFLIYYGDKDKPHSPRGAGYLRVTPIIQTFISSFLLFSVHIYLLLQGFINYYKTF